MTPDLTAWEHHIALPDGRAVFIRPLRPEDASLYPAFLGAVTQQDMRLRLFAPVAEFSDALIARFTQIDYAKAMAFIALDAASGEMLGVARLHDEPDGVSGEYAILVRSDLKGHGLGRALMEQLIAYARTQGVGELFGVVLRENTHMLQLAVDLGFRPEPIPGDLTRVLVRLDLKIPALAD